MMKRRNFLKYLKYSPILLLLVMLNCKQANADYVQLKEEIKKRYDVHLPDNTKCIFIINDNYCSTCVSIFSEYVLGKLHGQKDVLCFINSNGINVDLDSFRNKNNKNIHISTKVLERNNTLIPTALGAIFLENGKIDTIIYIETEKIAEQIDFISAKIFATDNGF